MGSSDLLIGAVGFALMFGWVWGLWKSISYAASRRKRMARPSATSVGTSDRAILFYSATICYLTGLTLALLFGRRTLFLPVCVGSVMVLAVLYAYCSFSTGHASAEVEIEARKRLSVAVPPGDKVHLMASANWIMNTPWLFLAGATWTGLALFLSARELGHVVLVVPGGVFVFLLWAFSQLNHIVVRDSGTTVCYGFPVESRAIFSHSDATKVDVHQSLPQRMAGVHTVTFSSTDQESASLPLVNGREVRRLVLNLCQGAGAQD